MNLNPPQPGDPRWEYRDAIGREHKGHLEKVLDDGRTYAFRDSITKELTVISGALLKDHAHRIW